MRNGELQGPPEPGHDLCSGLAHPPPIAEDSVLPPCIVDAALAGGGLDPSLLGLSRQAGDRCSPWEWDCRARGLQG